MNQRSRLGIRLLSVATLALICTAGLGSPGCRGDFDTAVIPPEDGGRTSKDGGSAPTDAGDTCPTVGPLDPARLQWKPPSAPQPGKCQADDVLAMRDYLTANPTATNEEFENFVKNRDTTCHDCIFADANGPTWPPAPSAEGKVVTFNVGACYALVSGKDSCGHAAQSAWDCEFQACADCQSQSELEPCRARSRIGVCRPTYDAARTGCTGLPGGAEDLCGSPFDSIRVQCVSSTTDAGKL